MGPGTRVSFIPGGEMGRRPAEEDLTGRIRELEEEILQLRNSVDKEDEKHRRGL